MHPSLPFLTTSGPLRGPTKIATRFGNFRVRSKLKSRVPKSRWPNRLKIARSWKTVIDLTKFGVNQACLSLQSPTWTPLIRCNKPEQSHLSFFLPLTGCVCICVLSHSQIHNGRYHRTWVEWLGFSSHMCWTYGAIDVGREGTCLLFQWIGTKGTFFLQYGSILGIARWCASSYNFHVLVFDLPTVNVI